MTVHSHYRNIIFRFRSYLYALWYRKSILEVCWGFFKLKSLSTSFSKKQPQNTKMQDNKSQDNTTIELFKTMKYNI